MTLTAEMPLETVSCIRVVQEGLCNTLSCCIKIGFRAKGVGIIFSSKVFPSYFVHKNRS